MFHIERHHLAMTTCSLCNKKAEVPIHLWNGNDYCLNCLRSFSHALADFAADHEELVSDTLWVERSPGGKHYLSFAGRMRNFLVSLALSLFIFFALASNGYGFKGLLEASCTFLLCYGWLSVVSQYDIYRALFPPSFSRFSSLNYSFFPHPVCKISDGRVQIDFFRKIDNIPFVLSPAPFTLDLELCMTRLRKAPVNLDPFYAAIPTTNQHEALLLDCSLAITCIQQQEFPRSINAFLLSPFLVCCGEFGPQLVWEDFFRLSDCVSVPCPCPSVVRIPENAGRNGGE